MNKRIIIDRDQCIFCPRFITGRTGCNYRIYEGKPTDCPEDEKERRKLQIEINQRNKQFREDHPDWDEPEDETFSS